MKSTNTTATEDKNTNIRIIGLFIFFQFGVNNADFYLFVPSTAYFFMGGKIT